MLVAQIKQIINYKKNHLQWDSIADNAYSKLNYLKAMSSSPYIPEIIIRLKNKRTPLSTKPSLFSILKSKGKRTYIVTISTCTKPSLQPILYPQLSENAKYGVLAHELSHALCFQSLSTWKLISIPLHILSKKATDRFEQDTDIYCIELGYGQELLAWSEEVRHKLQISQWRGAKANYNSEINLKASERYLNPSSIKRLIQKGADTLKITTIL
jgi:hypothetical protein